MEIPQIVKAIERDKRLVAEANQRIADNTRKLEKALNAILPGVGLEVNARPDGVAPAPAPKSPSVEKKQRLQCRKFCTRTFAAPMHRGRHEKTCKPPKTKWK